MVIDYLIQAVYHTRAIQLQTPVQVTYALPNPGCPLSCPYSLPHVPIPASPFQAIMVKVPHAQCRGAPWWCDVFVLVVVVCVWCLVCVGGFALWVPTGSDCSPDSDCELSGSAWALAFSLRENPLTSLLEDLLPPLRVSFHRRVRVFLHGTRLQLNYRIIYLWRNYLECIRVPHISFSPLKFFPGEWSVHWKDLSWNHML